MIVSLLLKGENWTKQGFIYAEHFCAVGYAASENVPFAHHIVAVASLWLLVCLQLAILCWLFRYCHNHRIHPAYKHDERLDV